MNLHKSLPLLLIIVFPLTALELPTVRATIPTQTTVAHLFEQPGTSTYICNKFTLQYKDSIGGYREHTENICGTIDAVVQKDNMEQDSTADYYAVDVSMNAKNGTSYPSVYADAPPGPPGVWVTYSRVDITVPNGAVGLHFSPTSQTISSPNQPSISVSFCAQGDVAGTCLSISGLGPTQTIQQANSQANDYSWSVSESAPCCNTIFGSQDDFEMIFSVPEGLSFNLGISTALRWTYFDNFNCSVIDGNDCYNSINLSGTVSIPDPDFSITSPLSSVSVNACQSVQVPVSTSGQSNFAGTVALSDSNTASYLSASFSPSSLALSPSAESGSSTMTLTASCNAPTGSSGYVQLSDTIYGTVNSGTYLQHSIPLTVYVCAGVVYCAVGFSANPSSVGVMPYGGQTQTTIEVVSFGHFAGVVTVQRTVSSPGLYGPNLPSAEWNTWGSGVTSTSVTLTPGQIVYLPLYITGWDPGNYLVKIPCIGSGTCAQVSVTTSDFGISASPSSLTIPEGGSGASSITLNSMNGFTGTLTLSAAQTPMNYNLIACFHGNTCTTVTDSTTVSLTPGGSASAALTIITPCGSAPPGSYAVSVTGTETATSPSISHSITIQVTVTSSPGNCSGGGSVAAGTLITLADGSQVPVQNLRVGMQLLSYDMASHQYVTSTINRFATVQVNNLMIIQTGSGPPLRVDQNPAQKVWAKLPDGTVTLMSVTNLQIGYDLFQAPNQTWVPITSITYVNQGQYVMYDIYTTAPGNYIANGYLDPNK